VHHYARWPADRISVAARPQTAHTGACCGNKRSAVPKTTLLPENVSESLAQRLWRHRGQVWLVWALAVLCYVLMRRGAEFYALDIATRVDHRDFRVLSPGSPVGHGYGIVGTAFILTNLLYLARRRLARWHLGSMRAWLDIHVFTGLFGSALVVFHSAFQLRSAVATLTAISLGFVVSSGLIGRYFYGLTPEPDTAGLLRVLQALDALAPGFARNVLGMLETLPKPTEPARASLRTSLALIPSWLREYAARTRVLRSACDELLATHPLDADDRREAKRLSKQAIVLAGQPVRALAGAHLLRSWRGLHRFMALLMILLVTLHVSVAWVFGYRWIFSE
jgi:dihydropyrimidine dehydrogenase (NAD+) subunit PreT